MTTITSCALGFVMALIWPLRLFGVFGTSRYPSVYKGGARVPFWILIGSKRAEVCFGVEVETFFSYSNGHMIVRAVDPMGNGDALCIINPLPPKTEITNAVFVGAPTLWDAGSDGGRRVREATVPLPIGAH